MQSSDGDTGEEDAQDYLFDGAGWTSAALNPPESVAPDADGGSAPRKEKSDEEKNSEPVASESVVGVVCRCRRRKRKILRLPRRRHGGKVGRGCSPELFCENVVLFINTNF